MRKASVALAAYAVACNFAFSAFSSSRSAALYFSVAVVTFCFEEICNSIRLVSIPATVSSAFAFLALAASTLACLLAIAFSPFPDVLASSSSRRACARASVASVYSFRASVISAYF
jgi:hypothetical protein